MAATHSLVVTDLMMLLLQEFEDVFDSPTGLPLLTLTTIEFTFF
jgi:hypothetical protein